MDPIGIVEGTAASMAAANVDTDQIIPARFLRYRVVDGYQNFLFHDLRFDANGQPIPDFVLNRIPNASILIAGENFGCGSSREGAVQALQHYGIKAVIAESFGQIFENNCLKNGLLPIRLLPTTIAHLLQSCSTVGATLSIDLPERAVVEADGTRHAFEMDDFWHTLLMHGQDTLELTLSRRDEVLAFERQRLLDEPWILPEPVERIEKDAAR